MDIATILGILAGIALIVLAVGGGEGGLGSFIDLPSMLVVFGGTWAAMLVMFPLATVLRSFSIAMKAFFVQAQKPQEVLNRLVTLAVKARKESVLALEGENFDYPFLKRAVRLVVDGVDQKSLRQILEIEIGSLKERHYLGQQVFEQMGMLAPAFGMIGTLIGLVKMLKTLSDPSSIGPAMAIALITTFYGALYANLVCIPFAKKLEQRSRDEVFNMEIIVEGVVAISQKENPNVVKEKLNSFLGPKAKIR